MIRAGLFFTLILTFCVNLTAQTEKFPVDVTNIVNPPYSVYYEDYYSLVTNNWQISMTFQDFNEPSREVALRLSLEGNGVNIKTRQEVLFNNTVTLLPGVPYFASGNLLEPYLRYENIVISGYPRATFEQSGKLPEGQYSFCAEVVDKLSGEILSDKVCTQVWIQLNDEPNFNTPMCGEVLDPTMPINLPIQWQLGNNISLNSQQIDYQFTLFEVTDASASPANAISSGNIIQVYQSDWNPSSNFIYDISYPALHVGKAYAFIVQARENSGKDIFKNNGFSAPCHFYFGYPEGGKIALTSPANNAGLSKNALQYFEWSAPDNLLQNQQVTYQLKISEFQEGEDLQYAIDNGAEWHSSTSPLRSSGYSELILHHVKKMPKDHKFVWQVEAHTGNQTTAKSEIFRVDGPPFIDEFWVNRNKVVVNKITNADLNDLSGIALVTIDASGSKVQVPFEHLKIVEKSGIYYLASGALSGPTDSIIELEIPAQFSDNKAAVFKMSGIRLSNEQDLQARGKIVWKLPLSTTGTEARTVESEEKLLHYNKFKLTGALNVLPEDYQLQEPYEFKLSTSGSSRFIVQESSFKLEMDGIVQLPSKFSPADQNTDQVSYPFFDQAQLFLMNETITQPFGKIRISDGLNISVNGSNYIIDLSGKSSPDKLKDTPEWKGIYFDQFQMVYDLLQQNNTTLNFNEKFIQNCAIGDRTENKAWVSGTGLELDVVKEFDSNVEGVTFNSFPSRLSKMAVKVSDHYFENGSILGAFKIPILSETEEFTYTIPISSNGFTDGYMDENLEGKTYVFNENGGQNRLDVEIKRAVFENKSRINMTLDVTWPSINAKVEELDGFMVWGNYNVGFYQPNGSVPVTFQTNGIAAGNDITIDAFGAGRDKNLYSFGFSASMNIGEDISGENGPPKINAFSIARSNIIPENYVPTISPEPIEEPSGMDGSSGSGTYENAEEESEADLNAALAGLADDYEVGGTNNLSQNSIYLSDSSMVSDSSAQLTLDNLVAMIDLVMIVAKPEQKEKLQGLKDKLMLYDQSELAEILREMQESGFSIKNLLDMQLDKLINMLTTKLKAGVDKVNAKIENFVLEPVDNNVTKFNAKIEKGIDAILNKVQELAGGGESITDVIEATRKSAKENVTKEFRNAVLTSVKTNITDKVTKRIDTIVTINVTNFLTTEIRAMGSAILDKNLSSENFTQITDNGGALIDTIGNQVYASFTSVSGKGVKETVVKTVTDAYENINWQRIAEQIKEDILKAAGDEVKEKIIAAFGKLAEGDGFASLATGLLNNVELDFSNIGEKLKNGDIGDIVSFDPSYIKVESKVATFEGMMKFTKDDPLWGDSWQASIKAEFKKPKPFIASAKYVNGKVSGYNYWFLELAVPSGLATPIVPGVMMDGVGGKVFKHMQYDRVADNYFPDNSVKFGAGLDLYCLDASMGASFRMKMTAELTIYDDYFNMELRGKMGVGFKKPEANYDFDAVKPVVVGTGYIGFNSKDNKLLGEFNVFTNTSPILCANGTMGINIGPGYWNVYVGKKASPITAKILCLDAIKYQAWFDMSNERLELGIKQDIDLSARSPWIKVFSYEVQPYLAFKYYFLAEATILFQPKFSVQEALLEIEVYAAIGALYKNTLNGKQGDWVLAGAYFAGGAKYKNTETEAYVQGHLEGKLTLLGISVGVDMDLYKDLKKPLK